MNEAFGSASRRCRAKPSMKSYWLRCASSAMTTMLRRSESIGYRVALLLGQELLDGGEDHAAGRPTCSSSRRSSRLSACTGVCRRRSWQRAKVPKSWSSRSLRSVSTTSVGFSIAGCRMIRAGVEQPSSGSCPSPACARPRRRAGRPARRRAAARPYARSHRGRSAQPRASVSSTATLTAWNWW